LNRPSQLPWWMPSRLAEVLRVLAPLRVFNSYGVFIARGNVPHQVPVLQIKKRFPDGSAAWVDLEPHWLVCGATEPPRRFAPHHPRIDHYLFYANFKPEGMKLPALCGTNPYYLGPYCLVEKIVTGLLQGDADAWYFFRQARQTPLAVRHTAWHYYMLTAEERRARAAQGLKPMFWRRELVGAGSPMVLADRAAFAARTNGGIRPRWEPFVFDKFHMSDDDALCVAGKRLNPKEVAVIIPKGKEPPRGRSVLRSVVDQLTRVGRSKSKC
jgi:hypothetical protein